jgi:hypothetical protein
MKRIKMSNMKKAVTLREENVHGLKHVLLWTDDVTYEESLTELPPGQKEFIVEGEEDVLAELIKFIFLSLHDETLLIEDINS